MAKLSCASCGAVNQDVSPGDPCWQCNSALGATPAPASTPQEVTPGEVERSVRRASEAPSPLQRFADRPPPPDRTKQFIVLAVVLIVLLAWLLWHFLAPHLH